LRGWFRQGWVWSWVSSLLPDYRSLITDILRRVYAFQNWKA
jgi:hypothetical protein